MSDIPDLILRHKEFNRELVLEEQAEKFELEEEMVEAIIWDFLSAVRGEDIISEEIRRFKSIYMEEE